MSGVAFVAWSRLSRRTRDLARILGADLVYVGDGPPYLRAWRVTGERLSSGGYRVVLAQLPQGPLLYRLVGLSRRLGFRLVADVHTGFVVYDGFKGWILNRPFLGLLRRADAVLAHNRCVAGLLHSRLGLPRVYVAYDPLPDLPEPRGEPGDAPVPEEPYLVFPASWAPDEPLEEVAAQLASRDSGLRLVVTGDWRRSPRRASRLRRILGERLVLTGYLPAPQYSWVLRGSRAVIAATRRECTVLSSLWEAVAAGKLAIVSATETLRSLLGGEYPCLFHLRPAEGPTLGDVVDRCLDLRVSERLVVLESYEKLRRASEASVKLVKSLVEELLEEGRGG